MLFRSERKFSDFLARYLPPSPGDIQSLDGAVVGSHQGLWFYTLGQRHGLDIGGPGEAWYVAGKDLQRNILTVVQGHDHPALLKDALTVNEMHWINEPPADPDIRCFAKTRYRQDDQPCTARLQEDGGLLVRFDRPQRAPTPGQSLVLYHGTEVLGGGVIERVFDKGTT